MSENTLVGLMLDGGWVMWALLVLSLASDLRERRDGGAGLPTLDSATC